jgi:enoyl-CoA hydratase/carnithine racemase
MDIPLFANVHITLTDQVATIEFTTDALNFLSLDVMTQLADAWQWADTEPACRAIVLCSTGRVFCGGVDFRSLGGTGQDSSPKPLYLLAQRLLAGKKPCIAAVQGAAVGAGLGLAMLADQRVAGPKAQFNASFAQLGFHAGFGLTATLPHVMGPHAASRMLLMAQPVRAEEALRLGLADELVAELEGVREAAQTRARVIAGNAPLAVQDMRKNLRAELLANFEQALERELAAQLSHMKSQDFVEGISAMMAKRPPRFTGA